MCHICERLVDIRNAWKIYGKWFCSKRCVDAYEKQAYENGIDL